jgi:sugar phosphate isomerase/epimerase
MLDIIKKVHAHMPYHLLNRHLPMILEKQINLEIYFSQDALQALDKNECRETAARLKDAGLKVTFHAPFVDLRPGALDRGIRQISMDRIRQAFDLATIFEPLKIVCHPSFDERYYVACDDLWLENSVQFWRELLAVAHDAKTVIALENVYEKNPDILRRLFEMLSCDDLCFCFDTGHFNVFARTPLTLWMEQIGQYIGHLHLHDNFGRFDEHLPVGTATFPFDQFFAALKMLNVKPTITLEAHSQEHLWQSMTNVQKIPLWDGWN